MVPGMQRWICLVLALGCAACGAAQQNIEHAEAAFDDARYDETRVWLEASDDDVADMPKDLRARYFYLRGMTAFRLGDRNDALHYLRRARATIAQHRNQNWLRQGWTPVLDRTLVELDPNMSRGENPTDHDSAFDDEPGSSRSRGTR